MSGERHPAVRSLRAALRRSLAARWAARWSCIWLPALAVTSLVLRVAADVAPLHLAWGFAALAAIAAAAYFVAGRRLPDDRTLLAVLDSRGGLGGLLMASAEVEPGRWRGRMERVPEVGAQWSGAGRSAAVLAGCILLCAACMLAPYQGRVASAKGRLNVDEEVAQLVRQLDVLSETGALTPEKIESLKRALEDLRREASGDDPVRTWEAIDHLSQSQKQAAGEVSQAARSAVQKAARVEAVARALARLKEQAQSQKPDSETGEAGEPGESGESASQVDSKQLAEAMRELAKMADEACAANKGMELGENLAKALRRGDLNAEQLRQLARAMRDGNKGQVEAVQKLAAARLIDPKELGDCRGACEGGAGDGGGDGKGAGSMPGEDGKGGEGGLIPGMGGISRGGGPSAMSWKHASSFEGTKFVERRLPPGQIADLRQSALSGMSAADATSEEASPSTGGSLTDEGDAGGSGHRQKLLPQHRPTVERYFEREE